MELREKYTYTISPFPDRPLRRNSAGNSGDHAGMMGCIYSLMPYLPLWRMRRLFTDPSLLFNDDDDESDDKDSKRRLSTMQRSYRNIQRHQKKSFIVVSSGRKTPSSPSRFGDRSPVNGNRPAGLHLVSPEVLKPLPRPKRQPSGHHSPLKSKLLSLSPLAVVKQTTTTTTAAAASRNTIPLNITDPEAGIVSSPALNHLTDFLPSSGDDDELTTRPRPSPLPLTLSTLPEEPSPTENGDSSVQRVQAIVHSLPTESRRSPSVESGSRSSVTPPPPPPPPSRTSRASIDTKTASELAVTVASSPVVVVVVTETVPASSSHSVRFSAPPPPPLPSRPPSSPHRVSTLVTTADDDAAAQEAARDAYLATRPDLLVTLATDLPPPSLSNRNKAPAKITSEAISSVASAIAGSQKESRNLVPPTT